MRHLLLLVATVLTLFVGCTPPCTGDEACEGALRCDTRSGRCVACVADIDCDDDNPCTLDACDLSACSHVVRADGVDCDTDGVCNGGAACADGVCVATPEPVCDDNIACTADACVDPGGCTATPIDAACDDGIACTIGLCDPEDGCLFTPDDGLCDDQIACTVDVCDPEEGCGSTPEDALCGPTGTCCEDGCAELQIDFQNCGDCGFECAFGQTCFGGLCEDPGECLTPRTADPSFQVASAWILAGGASIDATGTGSTDPGFGRLPFTSGAKLTTTGCVPALEQSGPVRLSFSVTSSASDVGLSMGVELQGIGQLMRVSASQGDWLTFSRCLGEAAYAGDVSVSLSSSCTNPQLCGSAFYRVDRLLLTADAACPWPGEVRNGDLESTGGWIAQSTGGTLLIEDDGTGTNRVLKFRNIAERCGPIAQGRMSQPLPASLPSPALRFRGRSLLREHNVSVFAAASLGVITLPGDDTWHEYTLCLDEAFAGFVWDVNLDSNGGTGSVECSTNAPSEIWIDDVALVSDEVTCP